MKIITVLVTAAVLISAVPAEASANAPEISAKAAVLISADTGEVIYAHRSGEKLPMASTTKIMTVLLTLESAHRLGDLYEEFTADSEAIHVEGSSMGLVDGDTVTKYALCCGMLLPSGNDAANAAAVRVAGSIEGFAELMNARAAELGLKATHFVTPSGLEGEGHGSSAYDMALLAREALRDPTFREICSCTEKETEFGSPPYRRWLKNTNRLLTMDEGVYGVKTGYTDEAGRCLVSACVRDGRDMICVTLNDPDDWNDHLALYSYGADTAVTEDITIPQELAIDLAGGTGEQITASPLGSSLRLTTLSAGQEDITFNVIAPPFIYAPVRQGDNVGELRVELCGREINRLPLYADCDAGRYIPDEASEDEGMYSRIINALRRMFS